MKKPANEKKVISDSVIELQEGDIVSIRGCHVAIIGGTCMAVNPKDHGNVLGDLVRQRKERAPFTS